MKFVYYYQDGTEPKYDKTSWPISVRELKTLFDNEHISFRLILDDLDNGKIIKGKDYCIWQEEM